jgi:VanZ family protein
MKKNIEFTKNWKHRNLLHIVGGFLMGLFLSLLFTWYVSILAVIAFANYWEYSQVKFYKATYSISDILLTTLGCTIATIVMYLFFNIA